MMTKNVFLILAVFALGFLFNACQKSNEIQPRSSSSLINDSEDHQLDGVMHPAIFQFAKLDKNGESISGWVINRAGEIREFETAITNWNPSSAELSIDQLIPTAHIAAYYGEKIGQLGVSELANNFEKIEDTFSDDFEMNIIDSYDPSIAFIGYAEAEVDHTTECPTENDGEQVLIAMEGGIQTDNLTTAAEEILDWLKTVNEDLSN